MLTLIDARGKKIEGEPSNRSKWEQFAEEIRQAATTTEGARQE